VLISYWPLGQYHGVYDVWTVRHQTCGYLPDRTAWNGRFRLGLTRFSHKISGSSHRLQVPAYRLATVGRRSFPVAASILWNSLRPGIQSSSYLTDFCHKLKTYLLHESSPDISFNSWYIHYASVDFLMTLVILATLKFLIYYYHYHYHYYYYYYYYYY